MSLSKGLQTPLFLVGGLMMMKSIDLTHPSTIFNIRVAFIIGALITFIMLGLIYRNIQLKNDSRPISIKKSDLQPSSPFSQFTKTQTTDTNEEIEHMTVKEYDILKWKQQIQQVVTTFGIVSVMHLYMGFLPPLFIQSYMLPMNVSQLELTKIHLLNKSDDTPGLTRPFGSTTAGRIQSSTTTATDTSATTSTDSTDTTSTSTSTSTQRRSNSNKGARKRR